ncbi:MAG TPA: hypothetical protein VFM15_06920 [Gammaproteobacteria bacterium]|nr:hypothetical protein [Gammaproteobacteria bacterium]
MAMPGALGQYPMSREASGTSWQPGSTPVDGVMSMDGDWMTMIHGYVNQVHDYQGGPRGATENFSNSMFMLMADRSWGQDTLGLRSMLSLDPLMGKDGYPLLLQTGETADGVHHLVDRQHPHDLFMALSASWSHAFEPGSSFFLYAGLPGEPALGPPSFMHRASAAGIPEAPITHHWLDSTHITFGVVTAGYTYQAFKFEVSAFHGREPDQFRYNIETGRLDSGSARVTWNPGDNWSLQVSQGYLHSPEALEPRVNQHRSTASASYNRPLNGGNWATTVAWGRDDNRPGEALNAYLVESELSLHDTHTLFARMERVQEAELFESPSPLADQAFGVTKLSVGYIRDWPLSDHLYFGLGGLVSLYALPSAVNSAYGSPHSYLAFARLKLK